MKFIISPQKLTIGDLMDIEDAQEGHRSMHTLVNVASKFVVSEDNQPVAETEALKTLRNLSIVEFNEVMEGFAAAVKALEQSNVPPANGGPS